jgi:hypothetical protein
LTFCRFPKLIQHVLIRLGLGVEEAVTFPWNG